jgi:toxin HigB-1
LIETFRHKGLRQLFEDDNAKGVSADQVRKLRQILALLDAANKLEDLNYPTFRLHPLKGQYKGY